SDIASALRITQKRLEARQHLARHSPRHTPYRCQQIVAEVVDARCGETRKLEIADALGDVGCVLTVLRQRRRFAAVQSDRLDPVLGRLRHGDRLGYRRMRTGPNIDARLLGVSVGVLLLLERLDVALAVRRVVNDPDFLYLAAASRPFALANRHSPSRAIVGNMSHYVAVFPLPFKRAELGANKAGIIVDAEGDQPPLSGPGGMLV